MELKTVGMKIPEGCNIIIGHSHFIKTVEDLSEALVNSVPGIKFGLAFCEASGPCLVRRDGTDPELEKTAVENALAIGAGHSFVILLGNAFPVNVLSKIRDCHETVCIYCATANAVEVVVACSEQGAGILGVIDGASPLGVESDADRRNRIDFLRTIGYKRG